MKAEVGQFFSAIREKLPGLRAFFLLGAQGELLGHASANTAPNPESFAAEYAMLLRIAQRASSDTGMGELQEQILTYESSIILLHRFPRDRFGILVCSSDEHLGRLRYELKRSLLYSTLSNL